MQKIPFCEMERAKKTWTYGKLVVLHPSSCIPELLCGAAGRALGAWSGPTSAIDEECLS